LNPINNVNNVLAPHNCDVIGDFKVSGEPQN